MIVNVTLTIGLEPQPDGTWAALITTQTREERPPQLRVSSCAIEGGRSLASIMADAGRAVVGAAAILHAAGMLDAAPNN